MTDAIRLKVMPQFPSKVTGGTGIEIDKEDGEFTVELDYSEVLPEVAAYVPEPNAVARVWYQVTGIFKLVPLTMLGGLSDAPADGTLYARRNGIWTPPAVSDLTDASWTPWVPSWTWGSPGGTPATFVTNTARYKQIGKSVWFQADVTITSLGVGNSAGLLFTTPVSIRPGTNLIGSGREAVNTGKQLQVSAASGSQGSALTFDNASPATLPVNSRYQFGGFYEAA